MICTGQAIGLHVYFKMPFFDHLVFVNSMQPQKLLQVLTANNFEATIGLGRVVACDFFIGNTDRIGEDGHIVNAGNVV